MANIKILRSFGTHDGPFHADEVTACAFLILFDLIDIDKIIRTRAPETLHRCEYVCDVGGIYDPERKLFDHHQADYRGSLSSAGMILQYLADIKILNSRQRNFFDRCLVIGIDAHDNGRELHSPGVCTYSHVISNFNPIEHDATAAVQDTAFLSALTFALGHLTRMWERSQYTLSCREIVAKAMKKKGNYLLFEQNIPWLDAFFDLNGTDHPAQFLIMPAGPHWKLRGIPPSMDAKMKVRLPLPQEWAGLLAEDLQKISGIKGAVFCHKGRFVSVWETLEDTLKALDYVLSKNSIKQE